MGVAVIVFGILSIFVVPQFEAFYTSLGAQLPVATKRFIVVASWFRGYWWALILLAVVVTQLYLRDRSGQRFAGLVHSAFYCIPFAGDYTRTMFAYRLAGWLYRFRNEPSLQRLAVDHLRATTAFPSLRAAAAAIGERLANGRILSEALAAHAALPVRLSLFAKLGETLHSFDEPLAQLRELFEADAGNAAGKFERGLMLMLYAVLALSIGSLVLALYEPIFHLGSVV
jgi:type IV pilus assembly protein PilC